MELVILVGNIGSGKSTAAKKLVKEGYVCVSLDAIRYEIGAGDYRFDLDLEPHVFNCGRATLREFMHAGYPVIADETNMNRKTRKKLIELAKEYGYKVKALVFPRLPMEESVSRRLKSNHGNTDKKTWEMVWQKFDGRYQEPSLEEGIDEIVHVS